MSTSSSSVAAAALALSCGLGFGALACSGEPEPAPASTGARYTLIDDMEGASGRIQFGPRHAAPNTLPGRWVSYADVQCDDLSPIPEWAPDGTGAWSYASLGQAYETLEGAMSEHAARLRTTAALVNTWGAGMGFQFAEPPLGSDPTRVTRPCTNGAQRDLEYPASPVDLSEFSGIAFWGMADPSAGATTMLVQFQDANTDPRGGVCDPMPESTDACYNGFGVLVTLAPTLERVVVDFSELEQNRTWGYRPRPSVVDLHHVYGLSFQIDTPGGTCPPPITCVGGPPELTFDAWIDDLYFVSR